MSWQEILGYAASLVVAVSLMMRSIVRLRWVNLAGAVLFTIYGLLIEAYPVAVLNFLIVVINLYFLWKLHRTRETLSVVGMEPDSDYLREFLHTHGADIARFQPGFSFDPTRRQHVLVTLRDLVPAGVVVVEPGEDGEGTVTLDYATPAYRDLKIGRFLYGPRKDAFQALGIRRLETPAGNAAHDAYLERMGFTRAGERFALDLDT